MYGPHHVTKMLLTMARNSVCANRACDTDDEDTPSGSWFLKKLRPILIDEMIQKCDDMLVASTKLSPLTSDIVNGKFDEVVVAIDKNKVPHYDKNPDTRYLVKSKYDKGTCTFQAFTTAKCVAGKKSLHLGWELVTRDKFNPEFVRKIIKKCTDLRIGANLYLLDREYYSTDVMHTIQEMGKDFIIPAKKDSRIKQAIIEHAAGKREAVSKHTISNGITKFTFNLVIVKAPVKKKKNKKEKEKLIYENYHVFATSLSGDVQDIKKLIPEEYKKRWDIETGYRTTKSIMLMTNSTNPAIRILFYVLSIILANIWIWLRDLIAKQTYDVSLRILICQMLICYLSPDYEKWPPPA